MQTKIPAASKRASGVAVPCKPTRRSALCVKAAAQMSEKKPEIAQVLNGPSMKQRLAGAMGSANGLRGKDFADNIGLPTDEGLFGFKPFAEQWCGRLAMMGFVTSIVEEAITGRGTLQQIGFETPSTDVLALLLVVFGGATLVGTADTVRKLVTRQFTRGDIARYKNFLGLNNAEDYKLAAAEMKRRGDFTTLSRDSSAIQAVRAEGMLADKVLAVGDNAQAEEVAREMKAEDGSVLTLTKTEEAQQVASAAADMKAQPAPAGPSVSLAAKSDILEQQFSARSELAYAQQVELTNGRYAMLGFLAAILTEAVTGKGIILQIIMYLKLSGLLGAASGF
eukprot:gene6599-6827_t